VSEARPVPARGPAPASRIRIVPDESVDAPQSGIGMDLLDGTAITIRGVGAHLVLADVVAILAMEDEAEGVYDYALAVMTKLGRWYNLGLPVGPLLDHPGSRKSRAR
jgi:hypothetical protein